jgi:purine-nucleoside phosphorylase
MIPANDHGALLAAAAEFIATRVDTKPLIGVILGSGLGAVADSLEERVSIPYGEIPGWPSSTVEGHAGQLVVGRSSGVTAAVMQGRVHLYEGYAPWQVAFPPRVLSLLGCTSLVLTNAAGAVNERYRPADLMLISDHINLQGSNPCTGGNLEQFGDRFFDMTETYDPRYRELAVDVASRHGLTLHEGVYAGLLGPSFETPAEIRMLARLGADAVGMSTVPEAIAARHAGMRIAGISCITNMAAGLSGAPLNHEEVMEVGAQVRDDMIGLMRGLLVAIAEENGNDAS